MVRTQNGQVLQDGVSTGEGGDGVLRHDRSDLKSVSFDHRLVWRAGALPWPRAVDRSQGVFLPDHMYNDGYQSPSGKHESSQEHSRQQSGSKLNRLDFSLVNSGFPVKVCNALDSRGILTVGALKKESVDQPQESDILFHISNVSWKLRYEVYMKLAEHGVTVPEERLALCRSKLKLKSA